MHEIEPFFNWRDYYIASNDKLSPFYRRQYSEFEFSQSIYNHYIHPQWDFFGSSTLYCKVLFVDYGLQFAVIEFIGEWNDAIHNDIMELKRGLIDFLTGKGIVKYLLIGENVLNFHASDDLYYEEWYEDIKDEKGWIIGLNFREHVVDEMRQAKLHYYMEIGEHYDNILWRKLKPELLFVLLEQSMLKGLV